MKQEWLEFNPSVFRIQYTGSDKMNWKWDLLTVDGSNPRETVYFLLDGDAPSHAHSDKIDDAIENEEWEQMSLEDTGLTIGDFAIDPSIFDTAGEAYSEIQRELKR